MFMNNSTKIKIDDLKIFGYHGCFNEEKEKGQYFHIDLEVILKNNLYDDDLTSTLDYVQLCKYVETIFIQKKYNLLERLASVMCDKIIEKFDLKGIILKIRKNKNSYMPDIEAFSVEVKKIK